MKTVEINGKLYSEKPENEEKMCQGCAFSDTDVFDCFELPPCAGIIFVEEEKK